MMKYACVLVALGCGAESPRATSPVVANEQGATNREREPEERHTELETIPDDESPTQREDPETSAIVLSTTGSVYWIVEAQRGTYSCEEYRWVRSGDRLRLEHELPQGRISYGAHVEGNRITLSGPSTFLPNERHIAGCFQSITVHTVNETHWRTTGGTCTGRGPSPFWYLTEQACLDTITE